MSPRAIRRTALGLAGIAILAVILAPAVKRLVRDLSLPLQYTSAIRAQVRAKTRVVSMISAAMIHRGARLSVFLAPAPGGPFFAASRLNRTDPGKRVTLRSWAAL